jgi:hypothetical protein
LFRLTNFSIRLWKLFDDEDDDDDDDDEGEEEDDDMGVEEDDDEGTSATADMLCWNIRFLPDVEDDVTNDDGKK